MKNLPLVTLQGEEWSREMREEIVNTLVGECQL